MKYVTVEVEVDESDDAKAEGVVLDTLNEAHGRDERVVNWQVVAVEDDWSDEAKSWGAPW